MYEVRFLNGKNVHMISESVKNDLSNSKKRAVEAFRMKISFGDYARFIRRHHSLLASMAEFRSHVN